MLAGPSSVKEKMMTIVHRTIAALATGTLAAVVAAAAYAEAHRAPDQP
jgi:hypothetical protein